MVTVDHPDVVFLTHHDNHPDYIFDRFPRVPVDPTVAPGNGDALRR